MSLAKALLEVQKELPAIEPDSVNPHFKNRYVSLNRLLAVTLPILHKHGVVLVQMPCFTDERNLPALTTVLLHEEGKIEATMPLLLEKDNSQGLGSAITYGRRFMLAAMLGVSGEKDDDGEAASATPKRAAKPKTDAQAASKPAVPRGERLRVRIQELAQEADKLREADPGTTWAEVVEVLKSDARPDPGENTWESLSEPGLTWLGQQLSEYIAAGNTGITFLEHVTLPI